MGEAGSARFSTFEKLAALVIVAGFLARVRGPILGIVSSDGSWYMTMAESLRRYQEFLVPWAAASPTYFQHFPPLFATLLSLIFPFTGPGLAGVYVLEFVCAAFLIGVAFFTTRDLYGRQAAFAVTALAATVPVLVVADAEGSTETLVTALFALTIWSIVKSLDKPWFILLGGLFAGLSYLSKASLGPFLLLAGGAGFAWRFYYARWGVFRDKYYLAAGAIFATFVVAWTSRNVSHFGWSRWETQPYATAALERLFSTPTWPVSVLASLVAVLLVLALLCVPFHRELRAAWTRLREESTSVLWLAVVTPIVVASFFIAAFSRVEGWDPYGSEHTGRYAITGLVPLLWLCLRGTAQELPKDKSTIAAWLAGTLVVATIVGFDPRYYVTTSGRLGFVFFGLLLGLALLAFASFLDAVPSPGQDARKLKGRRAKLQTESPLPGVVVGGLVGVVGLSVRIVWFPLVAACAAALFISRPSLRVLAVGVIFLAAGFQGASGTISFETLAEDLGRDVPAGATVGVLAGHESYIWPFLPDSVRMVPVEAQPDFLVEAPVSDPDATPPDGYTLAREYHVENRLAPLSAASKWIEDRLPIRHVELDSGVGARVYERAAQAE